MTDNKDYFATYGCLTVHREMLMDEVRVNAYWKAINENRDRIKGKVVLDVGAGTGLLSVYSAKAGARKVYAVEACENLMDLLKTVISDNKCENIIEVVHGEVENVTLKENVDIIISEWMGHCLILEGMLNSIISSRRFLKRNGIIIPERANMYAALCDAPYVARDWSDIKGINFQSVISEYRAEISKEPLITNIKLEHLLSSYEKFNSVNLRNVELQDILTVEKVVNFTCNKCGVVEGLCIWWDVLLMDGHILSTSPEFHPTHWKQTVIMFPTPFLVSSGCKFKAKILIKQVSRRSFEFHATLV